MYKFILFLLSFCCACTAEAQTFSPDQFRTDLDYLQTELPKRHTNLYAHLTPEAFSGLIGAIRAKTDSLDLPRFEAELFKLVRAIGDEHTRVEPDYHTRIPFTFDFFSEGIYITATDSGHRYLLYRRLDGIGGVPVAVVLDRFKGVVKADNPSYYQVFVTRFLSNPTFLRGLGLASGDSTVTYQLDGQPVTVPAGPLPAPGVGDPYSWQLLPGNILRFDYRSCMDLEGRPFKTFNDSLFATVRRLRPSKLVIDLRSNSGGNSGVLQPFLDSLKNNYLNRQSALFVLIGKETFSSALMNAIDLKRNYNAILIGEPTSGNINHYGETRGFRLPNTRIVIGYSTRYWENWKGHDGPLLPDQRIDYYIRNFKAGKDEAMEKVRQ